MSEPRLHDDHSVTLTNKYYSYLKSRDKELGRLEAAGVDNWEGYYDETDEEDDEN